MSRITGMTEGYGMPIVVVNAVVYEENKQVLKTIYNSARRVAGGGAIDNGPWGFSDYDINIDLIRFEYEYFDDKDHEAKLMFETNDVNIADNPMLQEVEELRIKWGYQGNFKTRIVIIQSSKVRYLNDKIILELELSTGAVNASTKRFKKAAQDSKTKTDNYLSFVDWANLRFGNSDLELVIKYDNYFNVPLNRWHEFLDKKKTGSTTIDTNMREAGTRLRGDTANRSYLSILESRVHENGQSGSSVVEQAASGAENGPYYTYTQDKKMILHNRDKSFGKDTKRWYHYRGEKGDLLSFVPKVGDKDDFVDQALTFNVDEEGKITGGSVTTSQNPGTTPPNSGASPTNVIPKKNKKSWEDEQREKVFKQLLEEYQKNGIYSQFFTGLGWATLVDDYTGLNRTPGTTEIYVDENGVEFGRKETTAVDKTAVVLNAKKFQKRNTKFLNYTGNLKLLEQMLVNEVRNSEMLATSAKARIIGDPQLECMDIIEIYGTAQKFTGKHYLMSVKHTIDSTGFYCDMESLMQGPSVARVQAAFNKLGKRTVDEKTGEVDIKVNYDIEFGIRQDFKLKVLQKLNSGIPMSKILEDAYWEQFKANETIEDGNHIILDEIRKIVISQILSDKDLKGTDLTNAQLQDYIDREVFNQPNVKSPIQYGQSIILAGDDDELRAVIKAGEY